MMQSMPETWRKVKLGDLTLPVDRKDPATHFAETFNYIDISAVDNATKRVVGNLEQNVNEAPSRARQMVFPGDVLVSTVRPGLNAVAAVPAGLTNAVASTGFCVLRPQTVLLLSDYLRHFVITRPFVLSLVSRQKGGSYPAVTDDDVRSVPVPLPPLSEQQRIVEILQEAEEIRRLRVEAEAKTAELILATFFHFFGDESKQHKSLPMRELVEEFRYGTSQSSGERGTKTLRIPNVLGDRISFEDLVKVEESDASLERLRLKTGDLLFVRTNGNPDNVGRCGVFDAEDANLEIGDNTPIIFASYLIRARLKPELMRPWFLHAYLRSPIGRARILKQARTAAGQYNINTEGLGAIKVPVPPLALQDRFLLEASKNRQITEMIRLSERHMTALAESLSAHAFSGKLTATWREANSEQLAHQASERDGALLSIRKQTVSFAANPPPPPSIEIVFSDRTDGIYSDLNREQHFLLNKIDRMFAGVDYGRYFTAEKIADEVEGPLHRNPQGVLAHLQVFAARGLLIPVSRRRKEATGSPFAGCYRLPLKVSKGQSFSGEEDIELPEQPGDDVRGELMKIQRRLATGAI
jgi:type I restriction enzyme, S subunit